MEKLKRVISGTAAGLMFAFSQGAFAGSIDEIDSSGWSTDPMNYGMTAKEFVQAESRAFIGNFVGRVGINQWFHFPGLSDKDDTFVVSSNNDAIYSIASVNASEGFELVLPDVGDGRFLATYPGHVWSWG